tara:strand:+ start:2246 stop:2998 length:753 start_codon:yes stop_codon:yes gene_type:complete
MLIGRSRYKSHGGIPHGSTNAFGSNLSVYYKWKANFTLNGDEDQIQQWDDQSSNNRHAIQETEGDQAAINADKSLLFASSDGDHYDLDASQVQIASQEGFVVWVVIKRTAVGANEVILGSSSGNTPWLEFRGNDDNLRFLGTSSATDIEPGDGTTGNFPAAQKMLVTVEREAGGTGNLNIWKNGVLLAQDSQAANTTAGNFNQLGARGATRYLNSTIYDVCVTEGGIASDLDIERVNAYLCAKHGISQTL